MAGNSEKKKNGKANGRGNGKANGKKRNGKSNGQRRRVTDGKPGPDGGRWVYAYQLDPPQPELRFSKLKALVREAQKAAKREGRLWTGRIVVETLITHLLIVTDHPNHAPAVNRAIEAELKQLDMGFALNGPARLPWSRAASGRTSRLSKSFDAARPLEKVSVPSR